MILSSPSIISIVYFSSAYELQDWLDLIEKTKEEIIRRSSVISNPIKAHRDRLTESLIQKRLDLIKPNLQDLNSYELPIPKLNKTYSGTLNLTIHSIHGSALLNQQQETSTLQNNYQFYVAIEIDTYNTFYPYAQTTKQSMQEQQQSVEFKDEVWHKSFQSRE